jgi:uncharacterized membrane protein YhdT
MKKPLILALNPELCSRTEQIVDDSMIQKPYIPVTEESIMKEKNEKMLVYYFGIIQCLHLFALIRAFIIYMREQVLPYPALPPAEGWTRQAEYFLIGNGIIDTLNIALSITFVIAYSQMKKWADKAGLITLTILFYSAMIFAYGTINAGAWTAHPLAYGSMAILYLPILILTVFWYIRN